MTRTTIKRLGLAALLFFAVKGLAWLGLAAAAWSVATGANAPSPGEEFKSVAGEFKESAP